MAKAEVWTTGQVAEHCGIDAKNVRKYMDRWGVPSVGREPGRGGANIYSAKAVRAAKEAAPGKGNRTPRKPSS